MQCNHELWSCFPIIVLNFCPKHALFFANSRRSQGVKNAATTSNVFLWIRRMGAGVLSLNKVEISFDAKVAKVINGNFFQIFQHPLDFITISINPCGSIQFDVTCYKRLKFFQIAACTQKLRSIRSSETSRVSSSVKCMRLSAIDYREAYFEFKRIGITCV